MNFRGQLTDLSKKALLAGGVAGALTGGLFSVGVAYMQIRADDARSTEEYLRQHRVDAYSEFFRAVEDAQEKTAWVSREFEWRGIKQPGTMGERKLSATDAASTADSARAVTAKFRIIDMLDSKDERRRHLAFRLESYFSELSMIADNWNTGKKNYEESVALLNNRYAHVGDCAPDRVSECYADKASAHRGDVSTMNSGRAESVNSVLTELSGEVRSVALGGS